MEINKKYSFDTITKDFCAFIEEKTIFDNGDTYSAAPIRKVYENSVYGRKQLQKEIPEPFCSAALAIFGETPTVKDILEASESHPISENQ